MTIENKITIKTGIVKWATKTSATGTQILLSHIGEHRFFVTLCEPCGHEELIWDGPDYEIAILQAEEAGPEWDAQIFDLT